MSPRVYFLLIKIIIIRYLPKLSIKSIKKIIIIITKSPINPQNFIKRRILQH